jgi:hypothetical protein
VKGDVFSLNIRLESGADRLDHASAHRIVRVRKNLSERAERVT